MHFPFNLWQTVSIKVYGGFHVWAVRGMAWAWVPVGLLLSATNEPERECGLTMMMMMNMNQINVLVKI